MNKILLAIIISAVFLVAGCASFLTKYTDKYYDEMNTTNGGLFDYKAYGTCEPGTCIGFVCGVERSDLCALANSIDINLAGRCPFASISEQKCEFVPSFNETTFARYSNKSDLGSDKRIMQFMIGQGASFSEFAEANKYCFNKLTMSVRWLTADEKNNYLPADKEQAACFLDRAMMPMYVQYSEGKNVNIDAAKTNAEALLSAGPVIITAEADFNSSNPSIAENVSRQLVAMKEACEETIGDTSSAKCLIAIAPRMGDYEGLRNALSDPVVNASVDLVAFGINSHYSTNCDASSIYVNDALPFARYALHSLNKSTVISYILIDEGAPNDMRVDKTKGPDCTWDRSNTVGAYSTFFSNALPSFVSSGTIGASLYTFNASYANPLRCNNCFIGSDQEKLQNWFGWCQAYVNNTVTNLPLGINPVVFASQPGGSCTYSNVNLAGYFRAAATGREFGQFETPSMASPKEFTFSCQSCISNDLEMKSVEDVLVSGATSDLVCGGTDPEIDNAIALYSDQRGLDPTLVRGVIWGESSFNRCAVSTVDLSIHGCNNELAPPLRNDANDQARNTMVTDPEGLCTPSSAASGKKFCAYGLMQNIQYPSDIYETASLSNSPEYTELVASGCITPDGRYNPFNATQSVCLGTYKLKNNIGRDTAYARSHAAELNLTNPDGTVNNSAVTLVGTYLGLHAYYGDADRDGWKDNFIDFKAADASTCTFEQDSFYHCTITSPTGSNFVDLYPNCYSIIGETDFIKFTRYCMYDNAPCSGPDLDYGSCVLARYRKMINAGGCSNAVCPSDARLFLDIMASSPITPP